MLGASCPSAFVDSASALTLLAFFRFFFLLLFVSMHSQRRDMGDMRSTQDGPFDIDEGTLLTCNADITLEELLAIRNVSSSYFRDDDCFYGLGMQGSHLQFR